MDDFDPKTMPTDCVSIHKHIQMCQAPLGDRNDVLAKFSDTWPAIQWECLNAECIDGRLKTGSLTLNLRVSFDPRTYGATFESDPLRQYFDEELVLKIQTFCDENGWTATFHDSAEDVFV